MAADVRIEIEDDKVMRPPVQNEVLLVIRQVAGNFAEDTTIYLGIASAA